MSGSESQADVTSQSDSKSSVMVVKYHCVIPSEWMLATDPYKTAWFSSDECARKDLYWRVWLDKWSKSAESVHACIELGSSRSVKGLKDPLDDSDSSIESEDGAGVQVTCGIVYVGGIVAILTAAAGDGFRVSRTINRAYLQPEIPLSGFDPEDITTIAVYLELDASPPELKADRRPDFLTSALKDSLFCDVILKVNEEEFKAHRMILATNSPVFEAMFKSESGKKRDIVVVIEGVRKEVLSVALGFLYRLYFLNDDLSLHQELLVFANRYQMDLIAPECFGALMRDTTSDPLELQLLPEAANSSDLKQDIPGRIKLHPNKMELFNDTSLHNISETRPELLMELLKLSE